MNQSLIDARLKLKNKRLNCANLVIEEILKQDLQGLIEIGLFGSMLRDNFTCNSDVDIYLMFSDKIPDRVKKGTIRSFAEVNECDVVFLTKEQLNNPGLLETNIIKNHQVLYKETEDD